MGLNIPEIESTGSRGSSDSLNDQLDRELKVREIKEAKSRNRFYVLAFIMLLCAMAFVLGKVLNMLALPISIIVWTVIFVFCLRGPVNYLDSKGINRTLGTGIAFLLMVGVLTIIGWIMFSPVFGLGSQFSALIEALPGYFSALSQWINSLYSQYSYLLQNSQVHEWVNQALAAFGSWASSAASSSAEGVVIIGSNIASAGMALGFSLVVSFWILIELPALGREIKRLFGPRYAEDLNILYLTGTRVMGGYIKGTLIQCLLIGVACGIGFGIMGIPSAAALGIITGLLNIIPVVGPWLGGALAATIGIFISPLIAVIALVYTIVVQQIVYTFISPKIMASSVDIHPALVIMALMTGSAIGFAISGFMGSFVGMLASIPAVAALKSIFVYYFEKKTNRAIIAPDGVFFKGGTEGEEANPVADATGEIPLISKHESPLKRKRKS